MTRIDDYIERGRRFLDEVLDLPMDEAEQVLAALTSTVQTVHPGAKLGEVVRVQGREPILEALELLTRQFRDGSVSGFSVYADVNGAGRFATVYTPAERPVDEADLPPIPDADPT